jgi:hypothetical protein
MAKGFFTQGVCLLTDGHTNIEHIKSTLQAEDLMIVKEAPAQEEWCFSGPALTIAYLPDVNGYASVDLVNHPWPDSMGDPKSDSMTFGAWSMGFFGPLAFPGGLGRARQHAWGWQPGRTVPEGHRGFIRIRISYAYGAKDNAPVMPQNCDPLAELNFASRAALAVLGAPGVLCYFNPNGEVLRDLATFREVWLECKKQKKIPLQLWMNVRFFYLNDSLGFMDTVGNGQLNVQDVEAIYPRAKYAPRDIDYYLRNVTHYLLDLDREIKTGEAIDGPGESNLSWTADVLEQPIVQPPRRTLRLYPKAHRKEVREALSAIGPAPA